MIRKKWWLFLFLFLLLGLSGFVFWAETPLGPMPEAVPVQTPSAQVAVETDPWLALQPKSGEATTGLIFYPGGRVDPRSYLPSAQAIASRGYLVVIVPMPLNLAVLGVNKAAEVMAQYPQIEHWVIGGHSLGGAMAASYALDHTESVDGLILWAAYPAASDDLSTSGLPVLSIYGTQDGLANEGKIEVSHALLPGNTRFVAIQGGNHAQFGWYGPQPGDGSAGISRQEQQDQITQVTINFLEEINRL